MTDHPLTAQLLTVATVTTPITTSEQRRHHCIDIRMTNVDEHLNQVQVVMTVQDKLICTHYDTARQADMHSLSSLWSIRQSTTTVLCTTLLLHSCYMHVSTTWCKYYHSFSTFTRRRDIADDGKTQTDVAFADTTNDACHNKHCKVMWNCPHSVRQCNSNLPQQKQHSLTHGQWYLHMDQQQSTFMSICFCLMQCKTNCTSDNLSRTLQGTLRHVAGIWALNVSLTNVSYGPNTYVNCSNYLHHVTLCKDQCVLQKFCQSLSCTV